MPRKSHPEQRHGNGQGLDRIGARGRAPPAKARGAQRGHQRPGNGAQAEHGPLRGGVGIAQLQLARQVVHPEHRVRHKAEGVRHIGQHHQHHGQRPQGRGGHGPGMGRDGDGRRHRQPPHMAPAQPAGPGADRRQRPPDGAQALARQQRYQRGRQQGAGTYAAEHQRPQGRTPLQGGGRQGHGGAQHHQDGAANARDAAPGKEPGHGQRPGAGRKAQRQGHPAPQQHAQRAQAFGQRRGRQRPDQIAQQVGRAQIGHLLAAEPAGMHHLRHQRRVGKARQADAAERGHEAGQQQGSFVALDHGSGRHAGRMGIP
ncbi:MAG: hypothetical protein GAK34_02624 [Delftia tsuruhatensis]|nr:MAG: hypothetical protein GAK34_02624 [Delftia tsuruhatensis]